MYEQCDHLSLYDTKINMAKKPSNLPVLQPLAFECI